MARKKGRKPKNRRGSKRGKADRSVKYTSRVVVKFYDYVRLPYEDAVGRYLEKGQVGPWRQLADWFQGITIQRLITKVTPGRIKELVEQAMRRDPTYHPPNFLTYFAVLSPSGVDPQAVAKALASWQTVEVAYVESAPTLPPQVNPADDPLYEIVNPSDPNYPGQRYLKLAPSGIDAEYAWGFPGGDGGGQAVGLQFVDVEQGWTITTTSNSPHYCYPPSIPADHEDLPPGIRVIHGVNRYDFWHGTAVLGVVVAQDNQVGGIGITPNVATTMVASIWPDCNTNLPDRENAIWAAIDILRFGDVLLLEVQDEADGYCQVGGWRRYNALPAEVNDASFKIIRLGTALGIVIVEAAGNEGCDLDVFELGTRGKVLNRNSPQFQGDSGAIMVAAANSGLWPGYPANAYHSPSNFGSRIDCFAWGEDILALGNPNQDTDPQGYGGWLSDTSGAAAIIAGAALAVQGIARATLGYRFSPLQIRKMLSDPVRSIPGTGNTLSANSTYDPSDPLKWNAERIGVMPNLRAIIDTLNLLPDLYIRDFVGDTGNPHTEMISASPDIILRPSPVPNPQAAFGEGSGTENDNALGFEAQSQQDNFIYVRVRNRGGSDAVNVTATVYWSEVATLVTPNLWKPPGGLQVIIPNVPVGNLLTVSPAITWPASDIPVTGHYCFVGLVGNANDPAPLLADFDNWDYYMRFIRENNNVTWRNFNVVSNEPVGNQRNFVELPFLITGPHDRARHMRLEVVAKLPPESQITVQVPMRQRGYVVDLGPINLKNKRQVSVNPRGSSGTRDILFPQNFRARAHLLVHIPENFRQHPYEVYVRQLYEGQEVGRITWRLAPLRRNKRPYDIGKFAL